MTPIILTLIAVAIVAGAVVLYRNHRHLLGSLALAVVVTDNDAGNTGVSNGAPTAPPSISSPDQ